MVDKINLKQKLSLFEERWSPRIIGQMNDAHLKLVKLQGEFVWHHHEETDELFYVVQGTLLMHFRDKTVELGEGELIIVPKMIEHKPEAIEECHVMLFELAGTLNTGTAEKGELTQEELQWI